MIIAGYQWNEEELAAGTLEFLVTRDLFAGHYRNAVVDDHLESP